jgi:FkbM family methyltransferase
MRQFIKKAIINLFPARLRNLFVFEYLRSKGMDNGYYKVVYAQQGEDLFLQTYFPAGYKGFYVDIGAFHPFQYSNTYLLGRNGWKGINIEPNPEIFELFARYRPNDINLNLAVGKDGEDIAYYQFNHPALNSLDREHVANWSQRPGFEILATKLVATVSLEKLLKKFLPQNQTIDFMSVDTEGWDLQVLQSNNWERYRPVLVAVEDSQAVANISAPGPIVTYLHEVGYELLSITGITLFFRDAQLSS